MWNHETADRRGGFRCRAAREITFIRKSRDLERRLP
jgi:hypothetical protein